MKARNSELDILRAFAVLLVVFQHGVLVFQGNTFWNYVVDHWLHFATGVDLFFVISGFVISGSFIRSFDTARVAGASKIASVTTGFYVRRLVRLCPAMLFWAFVPLLCAILLNQSGIWLPTKEQGAKFISAIFYIYNFDEIRHPTFMGYLWSLSVEMQFYLAFPIFLYLFRTPKPRAWSLAGLFAVRLVWQPFGAEWWLARFDGILVGVLLYIAYRSALAPRLDPSFLSNRNARVWLLAGSLLVLLTTATFALPDYPLVANGIASIVSGVLVWAAAFQKGYISRLGLLQTINWLGSRSYSLYLVHLPMMLINRSVWYLVLREYGITLNNRDYWNWLLISWMVETIVATEMTYRLLEKPFVRLSQKIGRRDATATAAPVEPSAAVATS